MRRRGEIVVLAWQPDEADAAAIAAAGSLRGAFLERCVRAFSEAPAMGAAAVIARHLSKRGPDKPPGD
jgi:hypothetical protein